MLHDSKIHLLHWPPNRLTETGVPPAKVQATGSQPAKPASSIQQPTASPASQHNTKRYNSAAQHSLSCLPTKYPTPLLCSIQQFRFQSSRVPSRPSKSTHNCTTPTGLSDPQVESIHPFPSSPPSKLNYLPNNKHNILSSPTNLRILSSCFAPEVDPRHFHFSHLFVSFDIQPISSRFEAVAPRSSLLPRMTGTRR